MRELFRNEKFRYVIFIIIILLSRLPFLGDGYGLDGDSWAVALTASNFHNTGIYEVSRLPGNPLHEWLTSLVVSGGPFLVNLMTAIFSTIGFVFFALSLRILRFRKIFLAAFTLAFVPVIYIHSTTTIDYNFALAFLMMSLYFILSDKPIFAGILIGLAIGCRITSGAMFIPYTIMILRNDGLKKNTYRIFKFILPGLVVGTMLFLPLYMKYGSDFFSYYDVPYPSIPKVLYKGSIETWGIIGILGLLISIVLLIISDRSVIRKFLFPRSVNEKFVVAWLVAIDIYIIAFLKLPMEAGYLIPMIPFLIMLLGKYLYDGVFTFLCIMLIASSFFCSITPEKRLDAATPSAVTIPFQFSDERLIMDVLNGPVSTYKSRRENGLHFVKKIIESTDTISKPSVLVCGRWYNQLVVLSEDTTKLKIVLRSHLDEPEAVNFFAKGYEIYFMPKEDYFNIVMRGVDLNIYGAKPYLRDERY